MCLRSCEELSVGQMGRSMTLLSCLKSATYLTPSLLPFNPGNAFDDHWEGSFPHFSNILASKQFFNSFSYILRRWNEVSWGRRRYDGGIFVFSFSLILTGGWLILSSFDKTSLKHLLHFFKISTLRLLLLKDLKDGNKVLNIYCL